MTIRIFMDCGAPSLYNKLSRKSAGATAEGKKTKVAPMGAHLRNRGRDDFSYVETDEYKAYRQDFVDFVQQHAGILEAYPNLDVINNAELTYENQKWMEEKGCTPLPVWHLGSDEKWLVRYIEEGYDYICIGGMVPNSKSVLRPALDRLWRERLTHKDGMPKVKVHGFAMTSFDLMYRYPWYSVDSKSWIDIAKFGGILVPPMVGPARDWLHPYKIMLTPRSVHSHPPDKHYRTASEGIRRGVRRYLKEIRVPLGVSEYKKKPSGYELAKNEVWIKEPTDETDGEIEVVVEPGARNVNYYRLSVNAYLYRKIEEVVPPWPWPIPRSIKHGKRGLLS